MSGCRGAGHSRVASYGQPRAQRTCSPRAIGYRPVACDTPEAAFAIPRVCSYAVKSFRRLQPCTLALTFCTDPCLGLASSFSISPIPQIPCVILQCSRAYFRSIRPQSPRVSPCVRSVLAVVVELISRVYTPNARPSYPWRLVKVSVWR